MPSAVTARPSFRIRHPHAATRLALAVACLALATAGCSRTYYRIWADNDAYRIVQETAQHPRWTLPDFSIQVPYESRMYDPTSPDCPPMPSDDPYAHQYMHEVDGMRGWPHWGKCGYGATPESPCWLDFLPIDEQGILRLDMDRAVRLALLHSTEYQEQLEELYLSALDVSFERFRLDSQFFGGYSIFYSAEGRNRPGNAGESQSFLELATFPSSGWQWRRLTSTGGDLAVSFANSVVWQLAGPNDQSATSVLDFSLIQPLLRAGGRERVLERLTLAERTLLYNVRQMRRYQKGFYLEITTGSNAGPGPSRRGGFFGGAGLEGFTGVGGGGFGRIGRVGGGGGGAGGGVTGGAGAERAGGFLGLLQDKLGLANQKANIAALRNSLAQLEAFFVAGRLGNNPFQVEFARQALLNAQSLWLNGQASYQGQLDQFKMDLGLPPQLVVQIEDPMLDRFNLIPPPVVQMQDELTNHQETIGQYIVEISQMENPTAEQLSAALESIGQELARIEEVRQALLDERITVAEQDIRVLRDAMDERLRVLEAMQGTMGRRSSLLAGGTLSAHEQQSLDLMSAAAVEPERLRQLPDQLETELANLSQRLIQRQVTLNNVIGTVRDLQQQALQVPPDQFQGQLRTRLLATIPDLVRQLSTDVLELSLIHARARTESVTLPEVEMSASEAFEIASRNRLDWMNARANLVDAWRLIEFNADDLQSQLDIVFTGDMGNRTDNPFSLDASTGRLSVGLQFDAPITRLSERNTYRQALIEYQQARRQYYRFVDSVYGNLRALIRTLQLNQINFELRRYAVQVAIKQVELARLQLEEPPRPGQEELLGATTARDLVNALSDLLNVQNDFLSVWVNYEVVRRRLDYDMGTMQLDAEGMWVDPGAIRARNYVEGKLLPPVEEGTEPLESLPVAPILQGPGGEPLPPPQAGSGKIQLISGFTSADPASEPVAAPAVPSPQILHVPNP